MERGLESVGEDERDDEDEVVDAAIAADAINGTFTLDIINSAMMINALQCLAPHVAISLIHADVDSEIVGPLVWLVSRFGRVEFGR